MAITYGDFGPWETGVYDGVGGRYLDYTFTGHQSGDLLVVMGLSAYYFNLTVRSITTLSGSASAWTTSEPAVVNDTDAEVIAGWATATTTGDITVRVTLRAPAPMGVHTWRIPAAEWSGTPAFTVIGPGHAGSGTDVTQSVSLSSTSTVLLGMADYSVVDGSAAALTPGSATVHAHGTNYVVASWTQQSSGTRSYGLSSDPGAVDYSGVIVAVPAGTSTSWTRTPGPDSVNITDTRNINRTQIVYNRSVNIG